MDNFRSTGPLCPICFNPLVKSLMLAPLALGVLVLGGGVLVLFGGGVLVLFGGGVLVLLDIGSAILISLVARQPGLVD